MVSLYGWCARVEHCRIVMRFRRSNHLASVCAVAVSTESLRVTASLTQAQVDIGCNRSKQCGMDLWVQQSVQHRFSKYHTICNAWHVPFD
jgi:hypothetical protein